MHFSIKRYCQGIIVLLSFVVSSAICAAETGKTKTAEPIGQVIWVKGEVRASQPDQKPRPLQRRDLLYVHDVILTHDNGSGQVAFTDSSVVTLRSNTEFKIDDYRYKPDSPKDSKSIISVIKGGFRTITGAIPKQNPDAYQVNTPVATIGVRGTDFSIYIDPIQGLLIDLNKGAISVRNQAGTLVMNQAAGITFGVVNSVTSAPGVLKARPAAFTTQPLVKPVPSSVIQSIPTGPKQSVPRKTVSGFCVG